MKRNELQMYIQKLDVVLGLCHKSFMKHVALMACVLAASVMPTATAQVMENANSKAYTIVVEGEAMPAGIENIAYPYRAASKDRSGYCDLLVQHDEAGQTGLVSIESCSAPGFKQEALTLVNRSSALEGMSEFTPLRIEWSIEKPTRQAQSKVAFATQ